jgi:hypothetical protein
MALVLFAENDLAAELSMVWLEFPNEQIVR